MASGSFTGTTDNQYITPRVLWSSTANQEANTSNLTVTLQLMKSSASSSATSGTGAWTVLINGTTYDFSTYVTIPANGTYVTVYTKTVNNIPHNSDGTKSVVLGWSGGIPVTSYKTTNIPNTIVDLDTIARASTVSSFGFTNGYIDQGIDITIASKVSTYYHDIHLYLPDTSGTGINLVSANSGRKSGGTHHINFHEDQLAMIYAAMPTTTSSQFTVYVRTYTNASGNTSIGDWQTAIAYGNINANVKPSITNIGATINNGLGGYYVQGKSTATIACEAKAGDGATISSYKFSGHNLNKTITSNSATTTTLTNAGTQRYTVVVTDSRGRQATSQVDIYVYPYSKPSFKSATVTRSDSAGNPSNNGTYAKYAVDGAYSEIGGKNTYSITAAHSSNNGSTYSAEATIRATTNINSVATGTYGAGALSTTNSYLIRFTIKDSYGATDTIIVTLSTISRTFNIKANKNGVAFGKIAEGDGIETAWDMTFKGSGEKSLIFESGSTDAWKTKIYKGSSASPTVLGVWDDTNNRSVFRYENDGVFRIDRPIIFNNGVEYIVIPENTDLNSMQTPGFYNCPYSATAATLKHCPTIYAFSLVIERHAGVKQTLTMYSADPNPIIYVRNYYNGTWGAWSRLCYAGENVVLWSGTAGIGSTLTLQEDYKGFKFLTCIIGTTTEPYGIVLGSFLDSTVAELHFGALFTTSGGTAGSNIYGAKFATSSGTSITLAGCGTIGSSNLSVRKIVGWR